MCHPGEINTGIIVIDFKYTSSLLLSSKRAFICVSMIVPFKKSPAKRSQDLIEFSTERREHIYAPATSNQWTIYISSTDWCGAKRKKTSKSTHSHSQRKTSREINTYTHTIHLLMLPHKTAWLFPGRHDKMARFIRHFLNASSADVLWRPDSCGFY